MFVQRPPKNKGECQKTNAAQRGSLRIKARGHSSAISSVRTYFGLSSFFMALDQADTCRKDCREREKKASYARAETLCNQASNNGT